MDEYLRLRNMWGEDKREEVIRELAARPASEVGEFVHFVHEDPRIVVILTDVFRLLKNAERAAWVKHPPVKPDDAEAMGYARFNNYGHLLVDIPNGGSTIACKTTEGKVVTFAFVPYKEDGPPQCVDISYHSSGQQRVNGTQMCPSMEVNCFTIGHSRFTSRYGDKEPVSLVSVMLNKAEKK